MPDLPHGFRVHLITETTLWASASHRIYRSDDLGCSWVNVCSLPILSLERAQAICNVSSRLFRAGVYHILPVGAQTLVIFAFRKIYRYHVVDRKIDEITWPIVGSRPLCVCTDGQGWAYYGEYRGNQERSPVHVMGSGDGGRTWQPVHAFKRIRHIHGVFFDPYTGWLWVATGDRDAEAGIWVTRDRFQTVKRIAGGSQQTRAVQLLFSRAYVYFGSDTEFEANHIYRLERTTGTVERLQKVEESVFWGCKVGEALFFSTAVEPSQVNRRRRAAIWGSLDGKTWNRLAEFEKDALPGKLFQYGQVFFPLGQNDTGKLWYTPYAARGMGSTQCLKVSELF